VDDLVGRYIEGESPAALVRAHEQFDQELHTEINKVPMSFHRNRGGTTTTTMRFASTSSGSATVVMRGGGGRNGPCTLPDTKQCFDRSSSSSSADRSSSSSSSGSSSSSSSSSSNIPDEKIPRVSARCGAVVDPWQLPSLPSTAYEYDCRHVLLRRVSLLQTRIQDLITNKKGDLKRVIHPATAARKFECEAKITLYRERLGITESAPD